jgi:predicted RNase H-like nuclease (RuvC/YqgF family)
MREFLKGLELDKETIDTIMAEHGKLITEAKEQILELKTQVNGFETEKQKYESKLRDYETKMQESSKSLKNYEDLTNENRQLKSQMQLNESNVKKEFSKFVANEVLSQVNEDNDFASVLENYKKENPQYFGESVIKRVQSSPTLNGGDTAPQTTNDIMNDLLRSAAQEND